MSAILMTRTATLVDLGTWESQGLPVARFSVGPSDEELVLPLRPPEVEGLREHVGGLFLMTLERPYQ